MRSYDLMNILGSAFAFGKLDNIDKYISKDCEYISEYANVHIFTAEKIIKRMKSVSSKLRLEDRYTFKLLPIKDIINNKEKYNNDEYAILLYQYNDAYPVAVVSTERDSKTGKITKILLSRNSEIYNVDFYREDMGEDSPLDLPSTVKPLTHNEVHDNRNVLPVQKWVEASEENNDGLYIWRKADEFMKSFLLEMGYRITESQVFEDCIGYKTVKDDCDFTIYMFAFGKKKQVDLNVDFCKKYLDYKFSRRSKVLFVSLNVKRFRTGKIIEYDFLGFGTRKHTNYDFLGYFRDDNWPELFSIITINDKYLMVNYLEEEKKDVLYKLVSAFNNDSIDIYETILSEQHYSELIEIHKQYGNMQLAYVCEENSVYSLVSYIENYGYYYFQVADDYDVIFHWIFYPFEEKNNIKDFIRIDDTKKYNYYDIPFLIKVEAFQPVDTERFALKLFFDNGECKKYVLPINRENEKDEDVSYQRHVFTDKIWQSAIISNDCSPEKGGYTYRFPKIKFINGFFLSSLLCYYEGTDYSEPELTDDIIYEDEKYILKRIWKWNANDIKIISDNVWVRENTDYYEKEKELDLLEAYVVKKTDPIQLNCIIVNNKGERICTVDFSYIGDFHDGMAIVGKNELGFGYIDKNLNFAIPIQYDNADEYKDGLAIVKRGNNTYQIDKDGKEKIILQKLNREKYQEIGAYREGRCKVSLIDLENKLAYHSDTDFIAGIWGFVNEKGEEIITPQYIYAYDFNNGIAVVCKGKWTIDKKWDNEYKKGCYWTETELWGAIDIDGNEVIPFIFDEISFFDDFNEIFKVHYGGWEKGKWGVIDRTGKWLAEPVFEYIGPEFFDGMFSFSYIDSDDDGPLGIYDIKQQKVMFEPQFSDVGLYDDGSIEVEVFDENLGRRIEKIIDKNGKEKFHSEYSFIFGWWKNNEEIEVIIREKDGDKVGLIDRNGKILYPCEKNIKYFNYEKRLIVFKDNDKLGLKDFDGKTIIPPVYSEIYYLDKDFYTVEIREEANRREGLVTSEGKVIVPIEFENIRRLKDGKHILCCKKGFCQMLEYIDKGEGKTES